MARKLPDLGAKLMAEIEAAWSKPQETWARRRLLVVRLIAQHELTVEQIMQVAEVSRQSVFTYRDTLMAGGVAALLSRKWAPGRRPTVRGAVAQQFAARLEAGKFPRARDALAWIKKRTHRQLTESGVRQLLRRVGGKLKGPRQSHPKKEPAKAFKAERPARLLPLPPYFPELNPIERFGGLLKAAVSNRLYLNLRKLEDHLVAAARPCSTPAAVASLIHSWLTDRVNLGAPA